MTMRRSIWAGFMSAVCWMGFVTPWLAWAASPQKDAEVPFVGCASDGQLGPLPAPTGTSNVVNAPQSIAQRLSYYKAENGIGVLGPRGWHCFSTYGSSGAVFYITPGPIDGAVVMLPSWKGLAGPAIEAAVSYAGTSGRFEVAKVIGRVFPAYRKFVQQLVADDTANGMSSENAFVAGPSPKDKLTYPSKSVVEFETPPNTDGLGTESRLQRNASPISGVAMLVGADTDLVQVSVRVSAEDRILVPFIVEQLERPAASPGFAGD